MGSGIAVIIHLVSIVQVQKVCPGVVLSLGVNLFAGVCNVTEASAT